MRIGFPRKLRYHYRELHDERGRTMWVRDVYRGKLFDPRKFVRCDVEATDHERQVYSTDLWIEYPEGGDFVRAVRDYYRRWLLAPEGAARSSGPLVTRGEP